MLKEVTIKDRNFFAYRFSPIFNLLFLILTRVKNLLNLLHHFSEVKSFFWLMVTREKFFCGQLRTLQFKKCKIVFDFTSSNILACDNWIESTSLWAVSHFYLNELTLWCHFYQKRRFWYTRLPDGWKELHQASPDASFGTFSETAGKFDRAVLCQINSIQCIDSDPRFSRRLLLQT